MKGNVLERVKKVLRLSVLVSENLLPFVVVVLVRGMDL